MIKAFKKYIPLFALVLLCVLWSVATTFAQPNLYRTIEDTTVAEADCSAVTTYLDLRKNGKTILYVVPNSTGGALDIINADICIYPTESATRPGTPDTSEYITIDMNSGSDIAATGYEETERSYYSFIGVAVTSTLHGASDTHKIYYSTEAQ